MGEAVSQQILSEGDKSRREISLFLCTDNQRKTVKAIVMEGSGSGDCGPRDTSFTLLPWLFGKAFLHMNYFKNNIRKKSTCRYSGLIFHMYSSCYIPPTTRLPRADCGCQWWRILVSKELGQSEIGLAQQITETHDLIQVFNWCHGRSLIKTCQMSLDRRKVKKKTNTTLPQTRTVEGLLLPSPEAWLMLLAPVLRSCSHAAEWTLHCLCFLLV